MAFAFEDLKIYRDALIWVTRSEEVIACIPKTTLRAVRDQLEKASLSIPLNIAEGTGRWHKADKRQFYWIARGSVFECVFQNLQGIQFRLWMAGTFPVARFIQPFKFSTVKNIYVSGAANSGMCN